MIIIFILSLLQMKEKETMLGLEIKVLYNININQVYMSSTHTLDSLATALDTLWVATSTILVFWMQAGFALVEVGSVRVKNSQNILFKNLFDICITTVLWWLLGYGMAYGESRGNFVGGSLFTAKDFDANPVRYRDFMFQWAFSGTMITIVSGAMAERTKIFGYILLCVWMNILVYPFIVHWTWGKGWLYDEGYYDFAGSGIVHEVGGVAALMGAIMIGAREGRWEAGAEQRFKPHNIPFIVTGTFVLWMGWYGFNGGSTLSFTGGNEFIAFKVMLNTSLSAVAAGFVVLMLKGFITKVFELPFMCNGILAGLVSITASCDGVTDYEAFIIGILGGLIVTGVSYLVKACKVDDAIDAFAVHGACGAWGAIAVGLFHQ